MGFTYGGMSLDKDECDFLQNFMLKHDAKSVVEFGAGMSTIVMSEIVGKDNIVSFENYQPTIDALKGYRVIDRDFRERYTEEMMEEDLAGRKFDLAFVDSPEGHYTYEGRYSRYHSMVAAKKLADIIVFHDVYRQSEMNTIDLLLSDWPFHNYQSRRGMSFFMRPERRE